VPGQTDVDRGGEEENDSVLEFGQPETALECGWLSGGKAGNRKTERFEAGGTRLLVTSQVERLKLHDKEGEGGGLGDRLVLAEQGDFEIRYRARGKDSVSPLFPEARIWTPCLGSCNSEKF